ncbi:MAG: right-handed parallel beta-helix repeat-containing protein [Krumholzibacteria bacterium]|nr:right-handed parallel beta-helix repeat-containing protein [Candidatus Krumholzibacteria bacterium]
MNANLVIAAMVLVGLASSASARTWHVAKDGSGDYAVIQDALDAAASGDTIRIGPGRFEDFRIYPTNGGDRAIIAKVNVPVMTIIGGGLEETIIGPVEYSWADPEPPTRGIHLIAQPTSGGLHVEEVSVENLVAGIYVENAGTLSVAGCNLRNCLYGINAFVSTSAVASSFEECGFGMIVKSPGSLATATDCSFTCYTDGHTGLQFQGVGTGIAQGCTFTGCIDCNCTGVAFSGAGGGVYDCRFEGLLRPIYMTSAAYPEILRNHVTTAGFCLYSNSEAFTAEGNVFQATGPFPVLQLYSRGLPHTIRGNHILRGTGLAVEILTHTGPADYHLDMTGNWWGTTDRDSLAAWIHDGNDVMWPPGGLVECTVVFEPFADAPIPAKRESLGGLKALFRGR